jgi:Anti-sigma-K factor rskA, C-terminal
MRPDFEDLVGSDLAPEERARLERVHELLIAAGPPPEPLEAPIELRPARRRGAVLALAAALAVAAFALGAALTGPRAEFTESMAGTTAASDARATLAVYDLDAAGNWPMELTVSGLPPAASGRPFELWLTRAGQPAALCGAFLTGPTGSAVVPMNAPYRFDDFDGWVIVEKGSETPLLTT